VDFYITWDIWEGAVEYRMKKPVENGKYQKVRYTIFFGENTLFVAGGKPPDGKKSFSTRNFFSTNHILSNNFESLNIGWWKRCQNILYYGSAQDRTKSLSLDVF